MSGRKPLPSLVARPFRITFGLETFASFLRQPVADEFVGARDGVGVFDDTLALSLTAATDAPRLR